MRLLLVEDDALVASGLKLGLERSGFTVDHAATAGQAQHMLQLEQPAAMVLDLGLPDLDGTQLVRWVRAQGFGWPVLILTARDSLEDTVGGLDLGADDYMTKPFRLPEVSARLRALVRRSHARSDPILRLGELALDPATRVATLAGQPLELSPREWRILQHLLLESPKVVPKTQLLEQLSGWERDATPNAIEVHVSRLRQKLGNDAGVALRTVRGLGYRLEPAPGEA